MSEEFNVAFKKFYDGAVEISEDYSRMNYPNLDLPKFSFQEKKKYILITREGAAHCFVNKTNGDVLKAASYSAPAKHARGNIFDAYNGLASMGPYGPAYLR